MLDFLPEARPALVLAPMQDVTDLPFMRVLARRSLPDWFVTEYFRVHPDSRLNTYILRSIDENSTGKPIFAQMIGRDIEELCRTAAELEEHPVAGIDLNLGCPAPVVYRKNAGGGLLRFPDQVDSIIGALREQIKGRFTVKTRLGFESAEEFGALIEVFRKHGIDGLTIHGRTVRDRYQTPVYPEFVKQAVDELDCPVIANGNMVDSKTAVSYHAQVSGAGLMIGRGAIRNPWIFEQIQDELQGREPKRPVGTDLLEYIFELSEELAKEHPAFDPVLHIQRMKKTLIYIIDGIGEDFEMQIRRMKSPEEFEKICRAELDHGDKVPILPSVTSKLFCGFSELLEKP